MRLNQGPVFVAKILIVDDDPVVLTLVEETLSPHGHQLRSVQNGHAAVASLQDGPYDLIIADLFMPGMDGFELIKAVRALHPEQKILTISGYGQTSSSGVDYLEFAENLGANEILEKPFRPDDLLKKVAGLLG